MILTSGAIPYMTARQMAAASLAVPKSVMNTIVGRGDAACAEGGVAAWREQAAAQTLTNNIAASLYLRERIFPLSVLRKKAEYTVRLSEIPEISNAR